MATITHRAITRSSAAGTTQSSGAFTPATGEKLIVIGATGSARTAAPTVTSDNAGDTFTFVDSVDYSTAGRVYVFAADQGATNVSQTLTFNFDSSTRRALAVAGADSSVTAVGAALIAQILKGSGAGSETPSASGTATASGNPLLGAVHTHTNNAGDIVEPSGWTELGEAGGTGNDSRIESAKLDAGGTASSYSWGGTVSAVWGAVVVEIDAGAGGGHTGTVAQTLPKLAQAASGTESIKGTVAAVLPKLAQAAAGTVILDASGSVAQTLPKLAQAAAGNVTTTGVSGSVAQALPRLTQAAAGTSIADITGTVVQTLPRLVQAIIGTVTNPASGLISAGRHWIGLRIGI